MEQPLVTYIIPAYNQERFVAESIRSALLQTYSPLEVLVLDDCSPDGTARAAQAEIDRYHGPHTIRLFTNARNQGVQAQVNRAVREARGRFVVCSAGDDLSTPDRVDKLVSRFLSTGAFAVYSNAMVIDDAGTDTHLLQADDYVLPSSWQQFARKMVGFPGCTASWDPETFRVFGALPPDGPDDTIAFFRASLLGRVEYINDPLVRYRRHGGNLSRWANEEDRSFANYLNLGNRIARDFLNLCRSFVQDLKRFIELRPDQADQAQQAIADLRDQIAFFDMRRRVTGGERLHTRELAELLRLSRRFPANWIVATAGLGVSPGLVRSIRRLLGRDQ